MKRIGTTSYPILLGDDALDALQHFLSQAKYINRKFFVLVDENTFQHCFTKLITEVPVLQKCEVIEIPSGEKNKDLSIVEGILHTLTDFGADRNSVLLNLGGGVICDMGGFSASIYQRGICFIHIPTTLLAMADASVGGKTGVNLAHLKNQIGTFSQPDAVVVNPLFLSTLPQLHWVNGWAEIVKIFLIANAESWNKIKSLDSIPQQIEPYLIKAIELKNSIVNHDFKEKGLRKILNFGHTIGHTFESLFLNQKQVSLLHGEAVALGMIAETLLSEKRCGLSHQDSQEIISYLNHHYVSRIIQSSDIDTLLDSMVHDKKNESGKFLFSLLKKPGEALFNIECTESEVREVLMHFTNN